MRRSISAPAAVAAVLAAIAAGHPASLAAPNDCLSAPNGAAPKGQHWYYHLDHTDNRKCWYLRDIGAAAAAPAAASSQSANAPPAAAAIRRAAPAPKVQAAMIAQPAERTAPPTQAPDPWPQPSRAAAASADASNADALASQPATAKPMTGPTAAPSQPAATPNAGSVWTDPPPTAAFAQHTAAAPAVPNAAVAAPEPAPSVVADPSARRAPAKKRAAAPRETQVPVVPASAGPTATSVIQNVLIVFLAALLAGAVFAVFALLRRRRPMRGGAAANAPRFGSGPERDDGLWLKWPRRSNDAQPASPIQNSLIPQQVKIARQSAPHR